MLSDYQRGNILSILDMSDQGPQSIRKRRFSPVRLDGKQGCFLQHWDRVGHWPDHLQLRTRTHFVHRATMNRSGLDPVWGEPRPGMYWHVYYSKSLLVWANRSLRVGWYQCRIVQCLNRRFLRWRNCPSHRCKLNDFQFYSVQLVIADYHFDSLRSTIHLSLIHISEPTRPY